MTSGQPFVQTLQKLMGIPPRRQRLTALQSSLVDDLTLLRTRLASQRLSGAGVSPAGFPDVRSVVEHFGALQSQDFGGSLWAVAQRMAGTPSSADIESALAQRILVRTWPMRGTLHLVLAEDAHWMVARQGHRALAAAASYRRKLGLDDTVLNRARSVAEAALTREPVLSRSALYEALEAAGVPTGEGRGLQIVFFLAASGVLWMGPRQGRQHTVVLCDEWVPASRRRHPTREEGWANLARRYFTAHGPATVRDWAWWAGLTLTDAREALALIRGELSRIVRDQEYWFSGDPPVTTTLAPRALFLPNYDEYVVAYTERGLIYSQDYDRQLDGRGNILFMNPIVIDAVIAGTWTKVRTRGKVEARPRLFRSVTPEERQAVDDEANRVSAFFSTMDEQGD